MSLSRLVDCLSRLVDCLSRLVDCLSRLVDCLSRLVDVRDDVESPFVVSLRDTRFLLGAVSRGMNPTATLVSSRCDGGLFKESVPTSFRCTRF